MATFFLRKKFFYPFFTVIFTSIVLTSVSYSALLLNRTRISIATSFYFLVTKKQHIEASAEFIKLQGGAGYLLREKDVDYIVFSVYLNEEDAASVCANLMHFDEDVKLFPVQINALYFNTKTPAQIDLYCNALNMLKEYMSIIEKCILLLMEGETQENVKNILFSTQKHLEFLSHSFNTTYEEFAVACNHTAQLIADCINKVVFVADLRYILCSMAGEYIALCKLFSV